MNPEYSPGEFFYTTNTKAAIISTVSCGIILAVSLLVKLMVWNLDKAKSTSFSSSENQSRDHLHILLGIYSSSESYGPKMYLGSDH
jgi:hypothetical protein